MNPNEDMTRLGGVRDVLKLAMPLILSMGSFTLMQFCDRIFLAWHSREAIQAALPAGILAFTMICLFAELAGYANAFVSQYHGAGDKPNCARAAAQGVFLALFSWPLMVALIPVARWLLRVSGHAPEVLDAELRYLTILMLGSIGPALNNAMGSFFIGRGKTRVTMTTNICANLVNVALAYALIFGAWGLPALGIAGAAVASTVAGLISPAILLVLFLSPSNNAQHGTRHAFRLVPSLLGRMLRFGLPSAVNVMLDVGAFTVFVLLTGRMEGAALATSNIALSINNLVFMPLLGLSIAVMTLVGNHQGARNPQLAQRATWSTLKVGAAYTLVIAISFLVFPSAYYSLFTGNEEKAYHLDQLLPMGRQLLVMMAIWGMFDVVNLILAGALKGAGDTRFVMIWSMVAAWAIWVPGQIVLVMLFHGGIRSIWIWMTVYIVILAGGYFLRFRTGTWKRITLIDRSNATADLPVPG